MQAPMFNSLKPSNALLKRNFDMILFRWLIPIFNRVDKKRIEELGPDLACAEWLIRNGAAVKWHKSSDYVNNYNALFKGQPLSSATKSLTRFIYGVDGTDSSISHEGFPHFVDCKHIEEMKLINCKYIGDRALNHLDLLRDSLKYLEIVNCPHVTVEGLMSLERLPHLQELKLSNLPSVENKSIIEDKLRLSLKNCNISYN